VRIHSQCLAGDSWLTALQLLQQLEMALSLIAQAGEALLYEMQEGHGIGPWPNS
jgi:GTP cyclohydrolase II